MAHKPINTREALERAIENAQDAYACSKYNAKKLLDDHSAVSPFKYDPDIQAAELHAEQLRRRRDVRDSIKTYIEQKVLPHQGLVDPEHAFEVQYSAAYDKPLGTYNRDNDWVYIYPPAGSMAAYSTDIFKNPPKTLPDSIINEIKGTVYHEGQHRRQFNDPITFGNAVMRGSTRHYDNVKAALKKRLIGPGSNAYNKKYDADVYIFRPIELDAALQSHGAMLAHNDIVLHDRSEAFDYLVKLARTHSNINTTDRNLKRVLNVLFDRRRQNNEYDSNMSEHTLALMADKLLEANREGDFSFAEGGFISLEDDSTEAKKRTPEQEKKRKRWNFWHPNHQYASGGPTQGGMDKASAQFVSEENKLLKAAEGYKGLEQNKLKGQLLSEANTDGFVGDDAEAVVARVLGRLAKTETGKQGGAFGTPHKATDRLAAIKSAIGGIQSRQTQSSEFYQ